MGKEGRTGINSQSCSKVLKVDLATILLLNILNIGGMNLHIVTRVVEEIESLHGKS